MAQEGCRESDGRMRNGEQDVQGLCSTQLPRGARAPALRPTLLSKAGHRETIRETLESQVWLSHPLRKYFLGYD